VRGRRTVQCELPVLYDTYTRFSLHFEWVPNRFTERVWYLSMTREEEKFILYERYIFNSLALMSLALVAPKTARFTCGVRIFDLNFSEILWSIRSRFFGLNWDGDEFRVFVLPYDFDPKNNAGMIVMRYFSTIFGDAWYFLSIIYSILAMISRVVAREVRGKGSENDAKKSRVIRLRYRLTDERTCISSSRNIVSRKHNTTH